MGRGTIYIWVHHVRVAGVGGVVARVATLDSSTHACMDMCGSGDTEII